MRAYEGVGVKTVWVSEGCVACGCDDVREYGLLLYILMKFTQ